MANKKTYYLEKFYKIQKYIMISLLGISIAFVINYIWQSTNPLVNSNLSPLNTSIQVSNESNELFGNIKLTTENNFSLAYAQVLINNIPVADFSEGEVLIRVYSGDVITIDGSAYKRQLLFNLTAISSNIDQTYLKTELFTDGNSIDAGTIVFK